MQFFASEAVGVGNNRSRSSSDGPPCLLAALMPLDEPSCAVGVGSIADAPVSSTGAGLAQPGEQEHPLTTVRGADIGGADATPERVIVLAQIIDRVRGVDGTIPACSRFDTHERVYDPPLPHLFQRPIGSGHQVFSPETVRKWLERTLARAPLHNTDRTPLRFTPHDFRRLFATDAVNSGLPIHIAAALLGHRNLNTTQGYTAVYPDEVIRAYQAFIHARRSERPTEEYREPTEAEWAEFERHFTLRKVAYGNCDRPYSTPCAHEHACVRCPMLRTEPSRLPLLRELEDNLTERVAEAQQRTWLGEVEGLRQTLTALREKKQYAERLVSAGITDIPQELR